jgi:hypothetical protein
LKGPEWLQDFVCSEEEAAFHKSGKLNDTAFEFGVLCQAKNVLEEKWHLPQFNASGTIFLMNLMDLYFFENTGVLISP